MSLKAWRRGFTENIKTARARPKAATESLMQCEVRAIPVEEPGGGDLSVHQVYPSGLSMGQAKAGLTPIPIVSTCIRQLISCRHSPPP